MAQISLWGAEYSDVPAVELPKTGGGTVVFYENGGTPTLQTKTYTVSSAGTASVTPDVGYDGLSQVDVSVPSTEDESYFSAQFVTENNQRIWLLEGGVTRQQKGWVPSGSTSVVDTDYPAVPANTVITPTTSAQTVGGVEYMMEGPVTINAMPSGTEGTPTATKSAVNNHSVTVTPAVTNGAGYISGGTHTGTAVSVTAAELVSGSQTVTTNQTVDVTNLAELVVSVSGGGGVTVTDQANATGTTCVISTGSTPGDTYETLYDGTTNLINDTPYPYWWVSSLSNVTITNGSEWRITLNSVEYLITAAYDSTTGYVFIGNPKYSNGPDDGSGLLFNFFNAGWGAWSGGADMPVTSYPLKVERKVS